MQGPQDEKYRDKRKAQRIFSLCSLGHFKCQKKKKKKVELEEVSEIKKIEQRKQRL